MEKKKLKRSVVGSICKDKDKTKPDYVKMRDGKYYRLESQKYQLESLAKAVEAGKLSGDVAESIKERINKIPEWIRFELVELVEKD